MDDDDGYDETGPYDVAGDEITTAELGRSLARIERKVDQSLERIEQKLDRSLDDHEQRLRRLERIAWTAVALGAAGATSSMLQALFNATH